jgi:hypothetical protein
MMERDRRRHRLRATGVTFLDLDLDLDLDLGLDLDLDLDPTTRAPGIPCPQRGSRRKDLICVLWYREPVGRETVSRSGSKSRWAG